MQVLISAGIGRCRCLSTLVYSMVLMVLEPDVYSTQIDIYSIQIGAGMYRCIQIGRYL